LKEEEELCLECDCGCHYLTLGYWRNGEGEEVEAWLSLHLSTGLGLWFRIKWAWWILTNQYHEHDAFFLDHADKARKLKEMAAKIEYLHSVQEDSRNIIKEVEKKGA